jgi:hypothetical protein
MPTLIAGTVPLLRSSIHTEGEHIWNVYQLHAVFFNVRILPTTQNLPLMAAMLTPVADACKAIPPGNQ